MLFTGGRDYWLGAGFHRVLAARKAGLTEIAADGRPGTPRDAVLFGISANSGHGLPRTNADKRKAVSLLLADPEWSQWSDRDIGRRCQVDHKVVSRMRRSLSGAKPHMHLSPAAEGRGITERKVRRGDTVYVMNPVPGDATSAARSTELLRVGCRETRRPIQWRRAIAANGPRVLQGRSGGLLRSGSQLVPIRRGVRTWRIKDCGIACRTKGVGRGSMCIVWQLAVWQCGSQLGGFMT